MNNLKLRLAVFALCFGLTAAEAQPTAPPPGLDAYIEQVLEQFEVPGVGVGIVKDGQVVLTKGYGVRRMGSPEPVNEHTLFSIASNSKAFTATALAMLIEEKRLRWEDRVIDYLPWFSLSDDYVTQHLTVRDLLVHHSGLPAYANDLLLFPPSTFSRKELLSKLKDVPLEHDFRSVYAYDNILYVAAGEVIEAVSGMEWETFVKQRIFDRVGMPNSVSRFSTLRQQPNVAYAHARRNGKVGPVDTFFDQNIGDPGNPAGGIASSAADMANWLITHLDSGRTPEQGRLFKPETTKQLWRIVRPMPISKEPTWLQPAQKNFYGYALGFRTYDYRGVKVVGHGGLLTGFVSQIAMVPEHRLGVVVLTNQLSSEAYWAIINHILDHYLDTPAFDWIAGYKKELDLAVQRQDSLARTRKAVTPEATWRRTLPLADYAGAYRDDFIGRIVIRQEKDSILRLLFAKSAQLNGKLEHFHGDFFRLVYDNPNRGEGPFLSFALNPDKTVREARFISSGTSAGSALDRLVLTPDKSAILDTVQLRARVQEVLDQHPQARFSYAFLDISTGEELELNARESFHAASTMKTPVMVEAFNQRAAGKFSLDDSVVVYNRFKSIADGSPFSLNPENDSDQTLYRKIGQRVTWRDLLYLMITESSNLATNMVIDQVGAKRVAKTLRDIGATDIQVLRGVEDGKAYDRGLNNTVTAYDLRLIFERMACGDLVNETASKAMVRILMDQRHRGIIPAKLPDGVQVANKTGSITQICHDSGIVFLPDGRQYVLVLLSGDLEISEARSTLATVSRLFYDYVANK